MYSVLTNASGALKSEYASQGGTDSHPNEAGYTALDTPFFNFLEENF